MAQEPRPVKIRCPVCNEATGDRVCPACGEDLGPLHETRALALASYNLGLDLARQRRRGSIEHALESLHLATRLKADFIEPYIVMGKLYSQQKSYARAIACWSQAAGIDPGNAEVRECQHALRQLLGGDENLLLEATCQAGPVRLFSPVRCTDGHAGKVWRILGGGKTGGFSHIALAVGKFFTQHYLVPAGSIAAVEDGAILIDSSRRGLLRKTPRYHTDKVLVGRVARTLTSYGPFRVIQGIEIDVTAADGTATLAGTVPSYTIKQTAGQLAGCVAGVIGVDNRLVCDSDLELAVARALSVNPLTRAGRVQVRSSQGAIVLEGTLGSPEARAAAGQLTLNIPGVKRVIDRLSVARDERQERAEVL
jgi:osmotically-inducible protein OsmY